MAIIINSKTLGLWPIHVWAADDDIAASLTKAKTAIENRGVACTIDEAMDARAARIKNWCKHAAVVQWAAANLDSVRVKKLIAGGG